MRKLSQRCRFAFLGMPAIIVFLIIPGCKVGPDYSCPEVEVPDTWQEKLTKGMQSGDAPLENWWNTLSDPVLSKLIEKAEIGNLDLKQAYSRVIEAKAAVGFAQGELYPSVDGVGFYDRTRYSENGLNPLAAGDQTNLHNIGLDSSWEIDVFGRINRNIESAGAAYQASIEDYHDVSVALYSEVARNYVLYRTLGQRIEYAQQNIKIQRSTLELTQNRFDAGLAPQLDIQQASLNLHNTESIVPQLKVFQTEAINRLSVLLGENPGGLKKLLDDHKAIPVNPDIVVVNLPRELLRQRPDIRRAERQLASQNARIGVAEAGLYPVFSLSGSFAMESTNAADLGDSGSRAYGFGPSFRWNLFDGNRVKNSIRIEEERTRQAYLAYEQTVLSAFEEVEDAMVAYVKLTQRRDSLLASVKSAKRSVELVETLYRNGLTDFQNVLDMQRSLFNQQDSLAQTQGDVIQSLIRIYRSLGGGWSQESLEMVRSNEEMKPDWRG